MNLVQYQMRAFVKEIRRVNQLVQQPTAGGEANTRVRANNLLLPDQIAYTVANLLTALLSDPLGQCDCRKTTRLSDYDQRRTVRVVRTTRVENELRHLRRLATTRLALDKGHAMLQDRGHHRLTMSQDRQHTTGRGASWQLSRLEHVDLLQCCAGKRFMLDTLR